MRETNDTGDRVDKTDDEWRELLTPEQYRIAREGGTEPAFGGALWDNKADGEYRCVCCQATVFDSDARFDSGTGWPSFFRPAPAARLAMAPDFSQGTIRTEVNCARCDAHLGHVFDDGPPPTGQRFCLNSGALHFEAR